MPVSNQLNTVVTLYIIIFDRPWLYCFSMSCIINVNNISISEVDRQTIHSFLVLIFLSTESSENSTCDKDKKRVHYIRVSIINRCHISVGLMEMCSLEDRLDRPCSAFFL